MATQSDHETPAGHEQVDLVNLKNLTVKGEEIYWKGKKLKTEAPQHLLVTTFEKTLAALIAIGAILAPVITYTAELERICTSTAGRAPFCSTLKKNKPSPPVEDMKILKKNTLSK